MALMGSAAIAIWSEIDAGMLEAHDAWHCVEHFPERMAIPGFLRGRRAAAVDPGARPQRFIFYEIESIATATGPAYLERLNNPTPWSRKIMAASRLNRTLCRVVASEGFGVGAHLLTLRASAQAERLASELAGIARLPGIVGAHLLQKDAQVVRPLTAEEKLRHGGTDASAEWIVLVEAYSQKALDLLRLDTDYEFAARYTLSQLVK
jgi:hypothetical protein